ncbi:MAG: hypothetical protein ACRC1K_18625 [Planctomycetia bacterium]
MKTWMQRLRIVGVGAALAAGTAGSTLADDEKPTKRSDDEAVAKFETKRLERLFKNVRKLVFTPEREAAALTFVRRHHSELADLLVQLKRMQPEQYETAVLEIFQVSETLATLKQQDEARYVNAVDLWVVRSRTELLLAKWSSRPEDDQEIELKGLVGKQLELEAKERKLEAEMLRARAKKLDEESERLRSGRDKLVENRLRQLLAQGNLVRKTRKAPPDKTVEKKIKGDAKTDPDRGATPSP